jgi:catechol 2,3-dioxygenase-like lactoylglutathione lyase family enzyme
MFLNPCDVSGQGHSIREQCYDKSTYNDKETPVFSPKSTFSGYSVDDAAKAKEFYTQKLGLELASEAMGLGFSLPGGAKLFMYEKPDHQPATFTVLNFVVDDIDAAVEALQSQGVRFERYELGGGAEQDDKNILRGLSVGMGPDIAWFKDPAGNVLAVLQDE